MCIFKLIVLLLYVARKSEIEISYLLLQYGVLRYYLTDKFIFQSSIVHDGNGLVDSIHIMLSKLFLRKGLTLSIFNKVKQTIFAMLRCSHERNTLFKTTYLIKFSDPFRLASLLGKQI